jgi:hypothetical protein
MFKRQSVQTPPRIAMEAFSDAAAAAPEQDHSSPQRGWED